MTTVTPISAVEEIKERLTPTLDAIDEAVRHMKRVVVRGQHAVEDATAAATLTIRVGSSRVDLQACKLEYSIVSPK